MKLSIKLLILICSTTTVCLSQTTNEISINTAVVVSFPTTNTSAYMIEKSTDLSSWIPEWSDWLIGNNTTNKHFYETISPHSYYRIQSTSAPSILSTIPENGSTNVNPNLTELTIEFPDDMKYPGAYAGGLTPSDGAWPLWSENHYWKDSNTYVMTMQLESNTQYAVTLSYSSYPALTTNGIPIMQYPLIFKTE